MLRVKDHITSLKNPRITGILQLQKPAERREQGVFVLEGVSEIKKALSKGYHFRSVCFCPEIITTEDLQKILVDPSGEIYSVSPTVFEKIAYRGTSGGIVAIAEQQSHKLHDIKLSACPLIIVLESVEKPGNLGAVLRTADAAGIDALLICDNQTDVYNPNTIRSSLGCIFTVPLAVSGTEEAITWLRQKGITILCTALTASIPYHSVDFTKPTAIVMGSEAQGVSKAWLDAADQNIIIPMLGEADSLNVSASTAIVVFEARRQRGFK